MSFYTTIAREWKGRALGNQEGFFPQGIKRNFMSSSPGSRGRIPAEIWTYDAEFGWSKQHATSDGRTVEYFSCNFLFIILNR